MEAAWGVEELRDGGEEFGGIWDSDMVGGGGLDGIMCTDG